MKEKLKKLDKSNNSPVFKNPLIVQMIKDGAITPNEIFYRYDASKYDSYPEFKELLNYAFCQDFKELLEKYLNKRV